MIVGYARVSTLEQEAGMDAQVRNLTVLSCEKLYRKRVSSVALPAQLNAVLDFGRESDTLVVIKLDRLARSVCHLGRIIEVLEAKRVALCIVNLGVDTSPPTGKLMLNVMAGVAQLEREMMLKR